MSAARPDAGSTGLSEKMAKTDQLDGCSLRQNRYYRIKWVAHPGWPSFSGGSAVALNNRRVLMRAMVMGIVIAGLSLSACGRKGGLEPPPEIEAVDPDLAVESPDDAEKPDRPFILDGLL